MLYDRFNELNPCKRDIDDAINSLIQAYKNGNKVLICGNGGSASDAEHIVGELMKGFKLKRRLESEIVEKICNRFPEDSTFLINNLQMGLPAISLCSHSALISAFNNDVHPDMVFAQQVLGYGKAGDIFMGLSTSGNSKNVVHAVKIAKVCGLKTIGFTGAGISEMSGLCDITIKAPAVETYQVQEYHLPIYHEICAQVEVHFYGGRHE